MATQRNSSSKSMNNNKRQPLSDISNFNLIPTSTLRKLVSSSSASSSKPQNVFQKPPISVSNSDSNISKPNNNSPNNNSTEENSGISVASSNFNSARNPNPLDISTVRRVARVPDYSLTTPGRDNEAVVYNRRQATKKSNLEATNPTFTSSLHENKRDKRKEIDEPFLSLPPTISKDKGKAIVESFSSLSPETKEDKGKGVVVLSTPVSGNKKNKGIVIHEPFVSSSPQRVNDKAKTISHEHFPTDEKTAEEKVGVLTRSSASLKKTKGKGMEDASVFSCPTFPKTRTHRSKFNGAGDIKPSGSWTEPNGKRKKRRKPVLENSLPEDFVNYWRKHFQEVDEFELPEEEASYSDLD
ncbi:uncharacterized protein LOC107821176 isoform X2 [Nicotiana tabacum]|uniref:Probable serine/threonine-protein kinase DDB_G0272282 isoform X2 n=1 Tax=Nicotiana tabacum TaxID=4097 RepID=A0A1S4CP97_TOBAC|nr:probable serine/threonine-protein kinase DDB_G0272282 isoform X2 [Nicotiana tomentosiformis]XP_016503082.1 PREDICTED: probable serine/threonine-protein kinase DDB_G0272282 isoform X2 [Nicotiana tabacum]